MSREPSGPIQNVLTDTGIVSLKKIGLNWMWHVSCSDVPEMTMEDELLEVMLTVGGRGPREAMWRIDFYIEICLLN